VGTPDRVIVGQTTDVSLPHPEFPAIALTPGEKITRNELNKRFGGGIQGGMLTPKGGQLMFLFSDPIPGRLYGYDFDGWASGMHDTYFYTGEGSVGRQELIRRNKILYESRGSGRAIHLFIAVGTMPGSGTRLHEYIGQFELDVADPYRREPVEDSSEGRSVLVFRLNRIGDFVPPLAPKAQAIAPSPATSNGWRFVATEEGHVDRFGRTGTDVTTGVRRERAFENRFIEWVQARGATVGRVEIRIAGQSGRLYTDTWVDDDRELFEAKASASRNAIRMAVAQLLDYRRHIDPAPERLTVILPTSPSSDLVDFASSVGVGIAVFDAHELKRVSMPSANTRI
jgi:5-methylcytosine-specific restriction protein A